MYRTGDLGRCLVDGRLEFLGRIDHQVKVRGFRIELGEIETVLAAHAGVREALVLAREDRSGELQLVAYVVCQRKSPPEGSALRDWLKQRLPAYMVPSLFLMIKKMPRTATGKIDRAALPAPAELHSAPEDALVAPRTPLEEVVAGMMAEVLGVDKVGLYDNFFELGGHSLLGTELIAMIQEAFDLELPMLHVLFDAPTPAGLAEFLLSDPIHRDQIEATAPLLLQLAEPPSGGSPEGR